MELWMSGEIQVSVYDSYRKARSKIENAVNNCLKVNDYGKGLNEWAYIAIIKEEETQKYNEIAKYSPKKKEVEFRLKIDYITFLNGDAKKHIQLISASLIRAINMMSDIGVKNINFIKLLDDIEKCLSDLE